MHHTLSSSTGPMQSTHTRLLSNRDTWVRQPVCHTQPPSPWDTWTYTTLRHITQSNTHRSWFTKRPKGSLGSGLDWQLGVSNKYQFKTMRLNTLKLINNTSTHKYTFDINSQCFDLIQTDVEVSISNPTMELAHAKLQISLLIPLEYTFQIS